MLGGHFVFFCFVFCFFFWPLKLTILDLFPTVLDTILLQRWTPIFKVYGGRDGHVDSEDNKVCALSIQNAAKNNSGNYSCWAYNQLSCTVGTLTLEFRGKHFINLFSTGLWLYKGQQTVMRNMKNKSWRCKNPQKVFAISERKNEDRTIVAWENSRRFARSPLEPSQNDV